ncbi:MAG: DegV family EDD domain-containing protein [Dehalococcoidia bacterium]|nr:DegV family EDD domain-containing protein [Dehalococcoidia bacterium]
MSIAVLVDSSSGITPKLADEFHVRLVPIHLVWDKKEYTDWVDITPGEFYARLKTSETLPTTSGSVQGEFYSIFEELRSKVDGIVAITLAANTPSAGYRSAVMAQEMVEGIPIEVIDSQSVMTPLGLVATAAARAADAGAGLKEVAEAAKRVIPKTNLFVNPGSISYFLKGGRISESEVGSRGESYIITVKEGKLTASGDKYATQEEGRNHLRELVQERARKDTPLHAAVLHAAAREEAEEFKKWIASQYNCAELWIGEASPVLAIHLSPDSLGIGFYNE